MTKVCVLTSAHSPYDDRIYFREAVSLKKKGYDVTIIAPFGRSERSKDGIDIIGMPPSKGRLERFTKTCLRLYQAALRQKADVYHFHDPDLLPWMLLLASRGKRVIYDVHEYNADALLTKQWLPAVLRKPAARFVDWVEKKISSHFRGIVTVNLHMADSFRPFNSNVASVGNFPLQWFIDQCAPQNEMIRYQVAYVGGLNKDRGYETIIETMNLLQAEAAEIVCSILGQIDYDGINDSYPRLEVGKNNNIVWKANVPFEEVPENLKMAQLFWLPWQKTPNNDLGTPVKLFEYMAAGRPIVASAVRFVAKIIEETNSGVLVAPGDAAAHANAIRYLIDHPDEGCEMGKRGRAAVIEKYNWLSQEKALFALYGQVLG